MARFEATSCPLQVLFRALDDHVSYYFSNFEFRICTAKFGARHPRVEEPLTLAETYPIQWREPRVDLAELARLRWIEGWSQKELAAHFGKTECAIQNYFQEIRRKGLKPLSVESCAPK